MIFISTACSFLKQIKYWPGESCSPLPFNELKTLSCSSTEIPLMYNVEDRNLKTNRETIRRKHHQRTHILRLNMIKKKKNVLLCGSVIKFNEQTGIFFHILQVFALLIISDHTHYPTLELLIPLFDLSLILFHSFSTFTFVSADTSNRRLHLDNNSLAAQPSYFTPWIGVCLPRLDKTHPKNKTMKCK